ncbi:MAG: hypothetical protein MUC51_13375 [Anaerolineae bacterium]|nr:hypothetical protein [Anaerolineae bacterium]
MRVIDPRRPLYRSRQFFQALGAGLSPLTLEERDLAGEHLPRSARDLFDAMSRADQRHSLKVAAALHAAGYDHPALLQAALLHDCAKREGGVRLWHRAQPAPARADWRYPMWAHLHHPERGAELAAAAGCDPLAVTLIGRHQEPSAAHAGDPSLDELLAALQAADDDN